MNAEERLAEATGWFIRVRSEDAQEEDLAQLKSWLEQHPDNAACYQKVCTTWSTAGQFASSPELMMGRRDALEHARRASVRRWAGFRMRPLFGVAASLLGALVLLAVFWQSRLGSGDVYETGFAERRVLTLQDGSVVNLDASTRLRVNFADEARSIVLEAGQASFRVARDPARPFRVRAGRHTVVALGTAFNVEVVRDTLLVTLIEGRVAVLPVEHRVAGSATDRSSRATDPEGEGTHSTTRRARDGLDTAGMVIELTAGQQLVAVGTARAEIKNNVDLSRATAWQAGQLFFDDEPLADAVARMNRYGNVRIVVDPQVGDISISGVFRAGDIDAFTDAVTAYFPVRIEQTDSRRILLVPSL